MASLSSDRRGTISSERSQASSIKSIELPPNISPKIVALNGSGAGSSSTSSGTHTPPEGQAKQAEKTSVKDRLTRMFSQRSLAGQEAAAAAAHNGVNSNTPAKKPTPALVSQPQSQQNAPSKPQPSPQSAPLKPQEATQQQQPQLQLQSQPQPPQQQPQLQPQQLLQQHLQALPLPSDLALNTPASSINGSSAPASSATSAAASPAIKPHVPSSKGAASDKAADKAAATGSNAASSAGSSKAARATPPNAHFVVDPSLYGGHEHYLKSSRRQEKLMDMFRGLLGKKPEQQVDNDLSLVSNWVDNLKQENQSKEGTVEKKAADKKTAATAATPAPTTFIEKYGKCQEIVGRGAFGIVRIAHKKMTDGQGEKLFAVKEFRRRPEENEKKYSKRLTSEFCISSILRHPNIIHTLDLIKDPKGDYCEVMEYCAGGDLYTLVLASTKLEAQEADCYFKQMMRGVQYIHEMGVAHRDLKPENLLLTTRGALKITDFGNGECFRMAWESDAHMVSGLCGSAPYIAPEEYTSKEFDARAVDVWACGVIYMAMRTGRHLWHVAKKEEDHFYARYLEGRRDEEGYGPIEQLHRARCRNVIYSILDPIATRRITAHQVLKSEWVREIKLCRAGEEGL